MERLITVKEIADLSGMSVWNALKQVERKGFPDIARRIGRIRLFDRAEVLVWVKRREAAKHKRRK